jgi:hypothetical protein
MVVMVDMAMTASMRRLRVREKATVQTMPKISICLRRHI